MITVQTHIYMIRHAESIYIHGEERSRGITEEGDQNAKQIADLFTDIDVNAVISSPYKRAVQTVQYLADRKGLTIHTYEDLRERSIKSLDYESNWDTIVQAIEKSFDDKDYAMVGGETIHQVQDRSIPIIERLLERYAGQHVVIGTHGNIMTIIMNYYNSNYGFSFWKQTSMPDIYQCIFQDKRLVEVNRMWNPK